MCCSLQLTSFLANKGTSLTRMNAGAIVLEGCMLATMGCLDTLIFQIVWICGGGKEAPLLMGICTQVCMILLKEISATRDLSKKISIFLKLAKNHEYTSINNYKALGKPVLDD